MSYEIEYNAAPLSRRVFGGWRELLAAAAKRLYRFSTSSGISGSRHSRIAQKHGLIGECDICIYIYVRILETDTRFTLHIYLLPRQSRCSNIRFILLCRQTRKSYLYIYIWFFSRTNICYFPILLVLDLQLRLHYFRVVAIDVISCLDPYSFPRYILQSYRAREDLPKRKTYRKYGRGGGGRREEEERRRKRREHSAKVEREKRSRNARSSKLGSKRYSDINHISLYDDGTRMCDEEE